MLAAAQRNNGVGMSRRTLLAASGAVCASFAVLSVWLWAGWGGPAAVLVVSDVSSVLAGLFAAACTATAAWSSAGRQRWSWGVMTAGVMCWVFGDAVWAFYEIVVGLAVAPFPSLSDLGYLLFPVAACVALLLLPTAGSGNSNLRLIIDGGIVAGSLFVIFWWAGLDDIFTAESDTPLAFAVSVAYPLTDILLLTVALLVLTRSGKGHRASLIAFAVGVALMALSDAVFVLLIATGSYVSGGLIDLGWTGGLLLLGIAAMMSRRHGDLIDLASPRPPSQISLWLPYIPVPFAVVAMGLSPTSAPMLTAAVLLVTAVLARQFLIADDNRRLLARLTEQAFYDPLTGLANRALLQERLAHAVSTQHLTGHATAVIILDLDDFKLVNDSFGHPAGDALLAEAARRISHCVPTSDTVARMGGDEFAVLIHGGIDAARAAAERVFDAFDDPFSCLGHLILMRPSIGVASADFDAVDTESADQLLSKADLAMYTAKRSQHGGVYSYTSDMQLLDPTESDPTTHTRPVRERRDGSAELQLFAELRRAIDHDDLTLVYQGKFATASAHMVGVEALLRWQHPQRGLLMPGDFLPLARRNGLMGAITEAVLNRAVGDAAHWRAEGTAVPFAVNLFPPNLENTTLPALVESILSRHDLPACLLTVEITEDVLLYDKQRTIRVVEALRDVGVRVAIDHFGIGYSGLSTLRELRIDELKIDRHLVAALLQDPRAEAIVRAVIGLTHELGLSCVAAGVENAAVGEKLTAFGCDVLQGNYCSPPMNAAKVLDLARIHQIS